MSDYDKNPLREGDYLIWSDEDLTIRAKISEFRMTEICAVDEKGFEWRFNPADLWNGKLRRADSDGVESTTMTPPVYPIPFVKGSDTSQAAAESMVSSAKTLRLLVLNFIRACGTAGTTDDEIEVGLSLSHQTASARRRELVMEGSVVDSGIRRTTRSGRAASVWIARQGTVTTPKRVEKPTKTDLRAAFKEIEGLIGKANPARPTGTVFDDLAPPLFRFAGIKSTEKYEPSEALRKVLAWIDRQSK